MADRRSIGSCHPAEPQSAERLQLHISACGHEGSLASLSSVGQTGPDPGELPPWPPLSPAMAAAAVAATGTADPPPASADPPEVPGPDEPDDQPAALPGGPLARAPRSRLRFAAIAAVTVLLVVSAVLLVTPAHRPGRTATLAPPATVPA